MIIDIKYHIFSLVAVFLALAIGIIIGGTVVSNQDINNVIIDQQTAIAEKLDTQINELSQENTNLKEQINNLTISEQWHSQYENLVFPALTYGQLINKRAAVIVTSENFDTEDLVASFDYCGLDISSITQLGDNKEINERQATRILELLDLNDASYNQLSSEDWLPLLSKAIGEALLYGGHSDLIKYLTEQNLLNVEGDYGILLDSVIIVGGADSEDSNYVNLIDLPLIDYLLYSNIKVYGVENSVTAVSYMQSYQNKKITTVDNIDTIIGKTSLIYALAGEEGNYGIKPTSHQLLPEIDY